MRRRDFLRRGALAVAALAAGPELFACASGPSAASSPSPSLPAGGELRLLAGTGPLAPADVKLKDLVQRWAAQHSGWKATLELVPPAQLPVRMQAATEAGSGPDLVQLRDLMPWGWSGACIDVSDVALSLQRDQGPFHEAIAQQCLVDGHWRAVPFAYLPTAWIYRQDLWGRVGRQAFVDTLADLSTYGALVRSAGAPVGIALDHTFSAAASWLSVLWDFGAQEVLKDGHTVALQSPAAESALGWAIATWKGACDPDGSRYDEAGAGHAFSAGRTAAAQVGTAAYLALVGGELAASTRTHVQPSGPQARATLHPTLSLAVTRWSKSPSAARDLVQFLLQRDNYGELLTAAGGSAAYPGAGLDGHPVWGVDPGLRAFNDAVKLGRWPGWPGPPNKPAQDAFGRYIVVDMFAAAITRGDAKAALAQAAQQLAAVYTSK